jgi:hypothetical protein
MMKSILTLFAFLCTTANISFCATDNLSKAQEYYKNATEKEISAIAYYARKAVQEEPKNPQAYFLLGLGVAWSAFRADNPEGDEGLIAFEKMQNEQYHAGLDTIKIGLSLKPDNGAELCWWISTIYSWMNDVSDSERLYLKIGAYEYTNSPYADECLFGYGDFNGYITRYPKGKHFREAFFKRGEGKSIEEHINIANEYMSHYIDTMNVSQEDQYLWFERAGWYERLNRYDNAIADYIYFLHLWGEKNSTAFKTCLAIARIYEKTPQKHLAIDYHKKAVSIYDSYIANSKTERNKVKYSILVDSIKVKIEESGTK